MSRKVTTRNIRQRIGDLVNRVSLRHDEFIIERKGKALAALIPVEKLEAMRLVARRHALEILRESRGANLTEKGAKDLAAKARSWSRRGSRRTK